MVMCFGFVHITISVNYLYKKTAKSMDINITKVIEKITVPSLLRVNEIMYSVFIILHRYLPFVSLYLNRILQVQFPTMCVRDYR